jgi:PhzF family phenazine biosynthesis protein
LRRADPSPDTLAAVRDALGLQAEEVLAAQDLHNGPHWLGLLLPDVPTVLSLRPDHAALQRLGVKVGVAARRQGAPGLIRRSSREAQAFATPADTTDLEVRAFAAPVGIAEDPVTGSLNASLAQWLIAEGHLPMRYRARQGTALGRSGEVFINQDSSGQVWVGGDVSDCIEGSVWL